MNRLFFNLSLLPLKGVNAFLDLYIGGTRRAIFFDIDKTYPELRQLDEKYETIRQEMRSILSEKESIPRYHELDKGQSNISAETAYDWKVFMLYAMGEKPASNRAKCPETCAVLEGFPTCFKLFFQSWIPANMCPPIVDPTVDICGITWG